jgi:hypothetical protein
MLRVPPDASLGNPLAVALDKQLVAFFNKSDFGFGHIATPLLLGQRLQRGPLA